MATTKITNLRSTPRKGKSNIDGPVLYTRHNGTETYDCAFLLPLAFPPDFPPVILMRFT